MTDHTDYHPELTVVAPTFNERANVRPLVQALNAALPGVDWEVVFVDDNSPDGTADEVRALAGEDARVRVIQRVGRRGLAGACIEGMLSSHAPYCAVIDADMQHDERRLAQMLQALRDDPSLDLAIGTRNADGGSSGSGLSGLRKWGSDRATALARRLLRITASDPMSGFFMLRRARFDEIAPRLQPHGFKILADMLSLARGRWKIREIGYEFRARQQGESKMDAAVALEFLGLLAVRLTGGLVSIRFVLFALVGLSGVAVQLAAVKLGLLATGGNFNISQVFGVAVAISSNFVLNNLITYRDLTLKGAAFWRGLASFYGVCGLGAVMNVALASLFYTAFPVWALASGAGALVGALWNFVASGRVTWRAR